MLTKGHFITAMGEAPFAGSSRGSTFTRGPTDAGRVLRIASMIALALVLAGCAAPSSPTAPTTGGTPTAPLTPPTGGATSTACEAGEGDLFLASKYSGGFLPEHMRPDLVEIAHDGTIRVLQGHTEPGPGETSAEEGALDGMTLDEAAQMLARWNYTYETEHLVITRGDEAMLPAAAYASFCRSLVDALPTLRNDYPHGPGCADALTMTWEISVATGTRTISMSDCAERAEEFESVQRDLRRLVGPG